MKITAKIDVPDGEYCFDLFAGIDCLYLHGLGVSDKCMVFKTPNNEKWGTDGSGCDMLSIVKCPECRAAEVIDITNAKSCTTCAYRDTDTHGYAQCNDCNDGTTAVHRNWAAGKESNK